MPFETSSGQNFLEKILDEILYLEPDEEITSVIDKIKKAQNLRLGLVVPREAVLLQSVVNLRLLLREAQVLGKEIAIVTSDRIGRNLAAQVGIPVFNSIEEQTPIYTPPPFTPNLSNEEVIELGSEEEKPDRVEEPPSGLHIHHFQENKNISENKINWKRNAPPEFKKAERKIEARQEIKITALPKKEKDFSGLKKIIWPIVGILLVLSAIASYLLLPKAVVTAYVESEDLKKTLALSVSDKMDVYDIGQKVIPGKIVEASREKEETFLATGKKNIGEKTKGNVTVYNSWESNPRTFKVGTKFSSNGKVFLVTKEFTVPGTAIREGNLVPGSISIQIEAENAGEEYNIKAGRFTIIGLPANQQEKIYATSGSNFSGGFSKEVQVVSQEDFDKAKNKLVEALSKEANEEMEEKSKGEEIVDKAKIIPEPEVISSAKVDQEAANFKMKLKYKVQAMAFDWEILEKYLIRSLESEVPQNKMIDIAKKEDMSVVIDKTAYDKGQMDITVNTLAKIAPKISEEQIKESILGKKTAEAEEIVKKSEGISKVEINLKPSWWFVKIPNLEKNVKVNIEYQTKL